MSYLLFYFNSYSVRPFGKHSLNTWISHLAFTLYSSTALLPHIMYIVYTMLLSLTSWSVIREEPILVRLRSRWQPYNQLIN